MKTTKKYYKQNNQNKRLMSILKRLFELRKQVENDQLIIDDINTETVKDSKNEV